jgi:hypothetical protein
MTESKSKNDVAWEKVFEKYQIMTALEQSKYFEISSNHINEFREARLMTKFDHKSQLPKLFADNNLSILPVSRGSYIIGDFKIFHNFTEDCVEIEKIDFPHFIESLNYQDITSEATAINCAFISGIIQRFTGESHLYPTVSGRMSSSCFDFEIESQENCLLKVNVSNSQIEIDGGYEGENSLNIIEAKNYISDDFLVRQLFYPYKLWTQKINKKVRPIFLTYTNGVFHLREYTFEDSGYYNSIKLVHQRKYAVQDGVINIEIIQQILNTTTIKDEPEVPFPQADSFKRVINLCELLNEKYILTKEQITQNYNFVPRQAEYYFNAGKYLGLLQRRKEDGMTIFCLTQEGANLFDLSIFNRQIKFIELILSHSMFNSTLRMYLKNGIKPAKKDIIQIMYNSNLGDITDETYKRRASTVVSWINWIIDLAQE